MQGPMGWMLSAIPSVPAVTRELRVLDMLDIGCCRIYYRVCCGVEGGLLRWLWRGCCGHVVEEAALDGHTC
jgi:hypothetical protein